MPVTGQQLVVPGFLQTYHPDVVIIMNPIYASEIRNTLESMNIEAEILMV